MQEVTIHHQMSPEELALAKSKAGILSVIDDGGITTVNNHDARFWSFPNKLEVVSEMGELLRDYDWKSIRKSAW